MNTQRQRAAWFLLLLGGLFLLAGLTVLTFATVGKPLQSNSAEPTPPPSVWVQLADIVVHFTLTLLQVDWTPARVGVLFLIVGLLLEAAGVYLMTAAPNRKRH